MPPPLPFFVCVSRPKNLQCLCPCIIHNFNSVLCLWVTCLLSLTCFRAVPHLWWWNLQTLRETRSSGACSSSSCSRFNSSTTPPPGETWLAWGPSRHSIWLYVSLTTRLKWSQKIHTYLFFCLYAAAQSKQTFESCNVALRCVLKCKETIGAGL